MEYILRVVKMRNLWLCSKEALGLIRWDLGGVGIITHYHSVLKENIRL